MQDELKPKWSSLRLYCHKPFCCNGGAKQRQSLFNKYFCFEFTGLTCCFSLDWRKEGFTVEVSGIISTVVKK